MVRESEPIAVNSGLSVVQTHERRGHAAGSHKESSSGTT